jgi:hypothetical protein
MHDLNIGDKHISFVGIGAGGNTGVMPLMFTGTTPLPQGGARLKFQAAFHATETVAIDLTGIPVDPDPNLITIGKIARSEATCMIVRGLPLEGRPVVEVLNQMAGLAESIVQAFESHFF